MASRGNASGQQAYDQSWQKALGRVLSHPARVAILVALKHHGTVSPTEAAEAQELSVGTSAYHMRTLTSLGLVRIKTTRPVRGAVEHFYELTPDGQVALRAIEAVTDLRPTRAGRGRGRQRPRKSRTGA
jgi:DNA-binding transcriptional ArsR family regulator